MSCASWSKLGGGKLRRDCPELELAHELWDWGRATGFRPQEKGRGVNLVIEIEFVASAVENAAAHPAGATLSTDFEISGLPGRPGLCAGRVFQPRAPLRKVPGVQLPHGAQQSSVPNGVAERNVTVARAFANSWARL